MADLHADEASRSLRAGGGIVKTDFTQRFVEEPGRADLGVTKGGRGCMVEIKTCDDGFNLDDWRDKQREWARDYCIAPPYSTQYWLWLNAGTDSPRVREYTEHGVKNANGDHWYMPRRAWLIPYDYMMTVDALVRTIYHILPYRPDNNTKNVAIRTALREQQFSITTLFAPFELQWAGKKIWEIGTSHPFSLHFLNLPPLELPTTKEMLGGTELLWDRVPLTLRSMMMNSRQPEAS